MNTTRTVAVPVAFVAGCSAAMAVVPHPHLDRIVSQASAFVGGSATAVAHVVASAASGLSSSPALAWALVGVLTVLVVAARLAMGWEARSDEEEGFDIR